MMTEQLPEPMTPPDCDLRGYDFMPLFGQKMFGSRFYGMALRNPRAGLAGMKLWWEAWTQCPAGSLPDDDFDLARMSDFGSDTRGWKAVKDIALHGFVRCSDGRLYHPVLAAEAIDAWERRRRERTRKAEHRAKRGAINPDATPPVPPDVPRDKAGDIHRDRTRDSTRDGPQTNTGTGAGRAQDVRSDRTGQDRTGTGQRKEEGKAAPAESPREAQTVPRNYQPRRSDPPHRWASVAESWEVDGKMVKRPVVRGEYIDLLTDLVLTTIGITDPHWRGDLGPLLRWLHDGFTGEHIVAAIRLVVARPGYQPKTTLAYFDQPVRQHRSAV